MRIAAQDAVAFAIGIGPGVPALAGEERAQRAHRAGQGRVLIFVEIFTRESHSMPAARWSGSSMVWLKTV